MNQQVVMIVAMRESGRTHGNAACSTMHLLKSNVRDGRGKCRRVPQNGLNRAITQPTNVVRLIVIVSSGGQA